MTNALPDRFEAREIKTEDDGVTGRKDWDVGGRRV